MSNEKQTNDYKPNFAKNIQNIITKYGIPGTGENQMSNGNYVKVYPPISFNDVNDILEKIMQSSREDLRSVITDCEEFSTADTGPRRENKRALWVRFRGFLVRALVCGLFKEEEDK